MGTNATIAPVKKATTMTLDAIATAGSAVLNAGPMVNVIGSKT
jgi:hypothetical protein